MRGQRPGGRKSGVQDKTNCRCIHPRKASLRRSPRFWPCRSGWGNGTRWLLVLTLHRPKQSVFLSLVGFVHSCLQNDTPLDQRLWCPIPTSFKARPGLKDRVAQTELKWVLDVPSRNSGRTWSCALELDCPGSPKPSLNRL